MVAQRFSAGSEFRGALSPGGTTEQTRDFSPEFYAARLAALPCKNSSVFRLNSSTFS
jgi:hypothetical protein